MLSIAFIDIRIILRFAWVGYALALGLLVLVLFHGNVGKGAQRWIDLGPVQLQPSELMKIMLALGLAAACVERAGWPDVQVWVAGVPVYPWADESALAGLALAGTTGKGLITWTERPHACGLAALPAAVSHRPARLV